jgi:hypothetical protein
MNSNSLSLRKPQLDRPTHRPKRAAQIRRYYSFPTFQITAFPFGIIRWNRGDLETLSVKPFLACNSSRFLRPASSVRISYLVSTQSDCSGYFSLAKNPILALDFAATNECLKRSTKHQENSSLELFPSRADTLILSENKACNPLSGILAGIKPVFLTLARFTRPEFPMEPEYGGKFKSLAITLNLIRLLLSEEKLPEKISFDLFSASPLGFGCLVATRLGRCSVEAAA